MLASLTQFSMVPLMVMRPTMPPRPRTAVMPLPTSISMLLTVEPFTMRPTTPPTHSPPLTVMCTFASVRLVTVAPYMTPKRP